MRSLGVGSLVGSFDTQSHRSPRRCGAEMPQLVHTPIERPPSQRCRMTACGRERPTAASHFHGLNDRASPRQFLGGPTIFHFRVARSDLVALGDVRVSTIGPIVSWTGPLGICFDRGWTASRPHIVLPRHAQPRSNAIPDGRVRRRSVATTWRVISLPLLSLCLSSAAAQRWIAA